jgi:hypothetical protein
MTSRVRAIVVLLVVGAMAAIVIAVSSGEDERYAPRTAATATPAPDPTPARPFCEPSAVIATTADAVRSQVDSGNDVCVTANITDEVDLEDLESSKVRSVGTTGSGRMDHITARGSSRITLNARFTSIRADEAEHLTIDNSIVGGTPTARSPRQLIFIPNGSTHFTLSNSECAWTVIDAPGGNDGYCLRAYDAEHATIARNWIHDIAADAIQIGGGAGVRIDRNDIGPVGANPGDHDEHSDLIQITGQGGGMVISNNRLSRQGYYDTTGDGDYVQSGNSGFIYLHGGNSDIEVTNNLIESGLGRTEVCNFGSSGTEANDIRFVRNTFRDTARNSALSGFEWDCDSGSGNVLARNIAVDPDRGFDMAGDPATVTLNANLFGPPRLVRFDRDGNCVSSVCNPPGQDPIGYRKPADVHW